MLMGSASLARTLLAAGPGRRAQPDDRADPARRRQADLPRGRHGPAAAARQVRHGGHRACRSAPTVPRRSGRGRPRTSVRRGARPDPRPRRRRSRRHAAPGRCSDGCWRCSCSAAAGSCRRTPRSTPCGRRSRPADPVAALQNHLFRLRRGLPDGVDRVGRRRLPARPDAGRRRRRPPGDGARRGGDRPTSRRCRARRRCSRGGSGPAYPELDDVDDGRAEAARLEELRVRALRGARRAPARRRRHRRAGRRADGARRRPSRCASGRARC